MSVMSPVRHKRRLRKAQRQSGVIVDVSTLWYASKRKVCGICGEVITDKSDASVDHIVALADGGKEAFENTRLAHVGCNARRHADKTLQEMVEERAQRGQPEYIPRETVRKRNLWRRHEPNFCAACGDVIPTRPAAIVRYRVPLDQGGEDAYTNMELIHAHCPSQG